MRDIVAALQETMFPPDPAGLRLLAAARATLGGLLSLVLLMLFETIIAAPVIDRVLGFAVAMFLGATVRDPTRPGQAWTIALAPLPVIALGGLMAAVAQVPYAIDVVTVAVVFVVIATASLSMRWAALGAVTLVGLLVLLLSEPTWAALPARTLVCILGAAGAALARFVVLPHRPQAEWRRLQRAIRRSQAGVLDTIAAAVRLHSWRSGERRRMRRHVARLNEAVMLAEPRLAPSPALHLLEVELLTERVARIALADLGDPAARDPVLGQLEGLRRAVVGAAGSQPPAPSGSRLGDALAALATLLGHAPEPALAAAASMPHSRPRLAWSALDLRPAAQAALASTLAIVGGELIAPSRWYWAMFAALALFQGTRSSGESVARAGQLILGTLAGVIGGLLCATLLSGHPTLTIAAIVLAMFLAFLAFTAAYGVMVFWITVALGLLFGMMGYFPRGVLVLRLEETAIGAAAGIVVACVVLAQRRPDRVRRCAADFLRALGAVVAESTRRVSDSLAPQDLPSPDLASPNGHEADLVTLTVVLQQRFQAMQEIAGARFPAFRLLGPDRLRRLLTVLGACDDWARELTRATLHLGAPPGPALICPALPGIVGEAAARIADSVAALTALLDGVAEPGADRRPSAPGHETAAPPSVPGGDGDASIYATKLLLRLDSALLHLRQRAVAIGMASAAPVAASAQPV